MSSINALSNLFSGLFDKENSDPENISGMKNLIPKLVLFCILTFLYGAVMGIYHSFGQAMVSGVKLVMLFLLTLLICLPSFYVIQRVLGSSMKLLQIVVILLHGFLQISTLSVAFVPIVLFFQLTGGNYHFIQLLHVGIFIFSGIFGFRFMTNTLKISFEKLAIYPQLAVNVFRIWIVIMAFVSIQLAWNLRPFMCQKAEKFMWFRKYKGNFYTAIIYSFEQLGEDGKPSQDIRATQENIYMNSNDTLGATDSAK